MKHNPGAWFEIYVQDMPRAVAFYEAVLDTKLAALSSPGMEMMGFPMRPELPGCGGALVRMPGIASGGSTLIYFECDDCAVEAGRVAPAGGRVEREKFAIGPAGHIALGVDPDGNMFGLHSMR